ncbi:MAG TPA: M13 family metallopeptidase [Vitreimonas sp.]|uniref:M13 family metallopeptidase n=1 Tax=Vitreimonas sp. TaxID=3069702 RepID=UPI002D58D2C1|nr:M13 family metallopeptidase [Vitreimonas sp.]HYD87384.1 M13 family metallopeptidase [Vitreimonas sp.]
MITITRRAVTASTLALAAGCAAQRSGGAASPTRARAAIGAFGIDMTSIDPSIDPGDDFFQYVNGAWLNGNTIPDDRTSWGTNEMLIVKAEHDVRAIIEGVAAAGGAEGSNEKKIADFYNAYLDQDAIDARGLAPIQQALDEIEALRTHEDVVRFVGRPGSGVTFPVATYISLDEGNPDRYLPQLTHAGLGLPEREYYRRDDRNFPEIRQQYEAACAGMLALINRSEPEAKARAILALEREIAELHWPVADRRERERTHNLMSRAQVEALAPRYPWAAHFEAEGLADADEWVVNELSAIGPLADLVMRTPVSTWKGYLAFHYTRTKAHVLPRQIDDANFAFYGRQLSGQPQQRERWQRAIQASNAVLGEAIGQLYVARHFPPETKAQALALVENMRRAYGERIDASPWMSAETKVIARQKLATFRPKIGYPDRWRDYSGLEIRAGDAFGNQMRYAQWDWANDLARLGRPSDREEWFMVPHAVNAYYNPPFNEIVFPAGYLQPPLFDPNADPAVNYGALGGVIGHEMGHGFDDQGAKSDAHGVLRDWWNADDVARFRATTDRLADQYSQFEPLPGLNLNGRLGLGENIGDNGGLQVAYHAYKIALNGAEAPVLDGTSGDQRFFMARAQHRKQLIREQQLRNQVMTGPHSPARYRINGVVRNMDAWYAAFNVTPDDALYLPPEERVTVW